METALLKIFAPTAIAFIVGLMITPFVTNWLYKKQMWKKKAGKGAGYGGGATPIFDQLHKEKDTNTPRMGGIVIWASVCLTIFLFSLLKVKTKFITQRSFLPWWVSWSLQTGVSPVKAGACLRGYTPGNGPLHRHSVSCWGLFYQDGLM